MWIDLALPYRDVTAGSLTLLLGGPARRGAASLTVEVADRRVDLVVLGASHQVRVPAAGLVETVACDAGGRTLDDLRHGAGERPEGYDFTAEVVRPGAAFGAEVAAIVDLVASAPAALGGRFPGRPDALTALVIDDRGAALTWRTFHTYPATGEIVRTVSTLVTARHETTAGARA